MDKILVTRSSMPSLEEYVEEIRPLWETHWLTNMGQKHQELEKQLKEYLGVKEVSLFSNGHMALELTLQAMHLHGEVITTPFTFASTTHAIVRNGLTPVFCDINPEDYTIDVEEIERHITDATTAIVPVHVYGKICAVEEISYIAKKYGLKVIYDAAHAFGEAYRGTGIGNFGDASMLSFHATKVYNTIEGGAICYSDQELGLELYRLKNFGIRSEDVIDEVGANAKMNEFQAAMGICNLRHVDAQIQKRRAVCECYEALLSDIDGIRIAPPQQEVQQNYAYFPILIDEKAFGRTRNEVYELLKEQNIFTRKYFYPLTSTFDCYHGMADPALTPRARHISLRVLTLPLYADLPLSAAETICQHIRSMKKW